VLTPPQECVQYACGLPTVCPFFVVEFEVPEGLSFVLTDKTISRQFIMHVDLRFIVNDGLVIHVLAAILGVLLVVFVRAAFRDRTGRPALRLAMATVCVIMCLAWPFAEKTIKGLWPIGWDCLGVGDPLDNRRSALINYFEQPVSAAWMPGAVPKNLIWLIVESLEKQMLWRFNQRGWAHSMLYLSSLTERGIFCGNMPAPSYTDWSSASLLAATCGLPTVCQVPQSRVQAQILTNASSFKCLGDYLEKLGYRLEMCGSGHDIGGFQMIATTHGFRRVKWFPDGDRSMMAYAGGSLLMNLSKEFHDTRRPFALVMCTADTHKTGCITCSTRSNVTGYPRMLRAYDCVDQRVEALLERGLKRANLTQDNTEVVIYGDHTSWTAGNDVIKGTRGDRDLVLFFPMQPRKVIAKRVTQYDILPTVLDHLGIAYKPSLPFGGSVHDPRVFIPPSSAELSWLFERFQIQQRPA